MERLFLIIGSVSAFLAVALGAFGAHGLKSKLSPEMLNTFEIGVRYQMYHALALLVVAWACTKWPNALTYTSGWLFLAGILIFSGSLYIMSISGLRWLGAVTPFGGVAFLAGWGCFVLAVLRN